jgi:hypothetical protein
VPPRKTLTLFVVIAVCLLAVGGWYWNIIQDQAVAEGLCRSIQGGIDSGDAADLAALLADDYEVDLHWPLVATLSQTGLVSQEGDRRDLARQLLARWFFARRGEHREAVCHLEALRPLPEGSARPGHLAEAITADLEATVTLGVRVGEKPLLPDTTIVFWLRRDGALLPGARIVAHEIVSTSGIR